MGSRAEHGGMPVGEYAVGCVCREVLAQPGHLCGQIPRQGAVQRDDVPVSQLEAVIAPLVRSSGGTEILEVGTAASGQVVVIAWRRASASLVAPPGWLVAALELVVGPPRVGVIAKREDGACDAIEQAGRRAGASEQIAIGNVARSDEDELVRIRRPLGSSDGECRGSEQHRPKQYRFGFDTRSVSRCSTSSLTRLTSLYSWATTCTGPNVLRTSRRKLEDPYKPRLDAGVKFRAALTNHDSRTPS